jgi:glucose/arabinose dehydrogenase
MAVCGDILFVGTKGSSVYAVPLSGGRARRVASGFSAPNGVACSRGRLFVASRDRITAFDIGPQGALSGRRDIRRDLPSSGAHSLRYIAVGPDSRLYVSLGSPCNICQPRGLQGTIVSMNQDGSGLRRVATGVRNSVGFDWRGGTMFFTDNGADGMGDDIPPDELNALRPGGFYGFPYFGGQIRLKGFEDATPPARQIPPAFNFQAHVATLGIHFFRSLGGDALVAEHGSWDRSVPVGYQVVRVRFRGGRPVSATTFLRNVGRPVDVKEAPDGSILVSDDAGGAIHIFRR